MCVSYKDEVYAYLSQYCVVKRYQDSVNSYEMKGFYWDLVLFQSFSYPHGSEHDDTQADVVAIQQHLGPKAEEERE